jgi:hypothetical protein
MHMRKSLLVAAMFLLVFALPLRGAAPREGSEPVSGKGAAGAPIRSPEYGVDDFSVTSSWTGGMAVAYAPATIFKINNGSGYFYMTGLDSMVGSFSIPSGVEIDYIAFENCDTVGGHWTMYLYDQNTLVDSFASGAKVGCGWEYHPAGALLYQYDTNEFHSLRIYVTQDASAPVDGSDGVRGVNIYWLRKVSPVPAIQTFNDVAPADFGYQYIEALAASGITGGCGGGNFCPNGTLTRAQMAVFISKALGLYWPR